MKTSNVLFFLGLLCLSFSLPGFPPVQAQMANYVCQPKLCPACLTIQGGVCIYEIYVYDGCNASEGQTCNLNDEFWNCQGLTYRHLFKSGRYGRYLYRGQSSLYSRQYVSAARLSAAWLSDSITGLGDLAQLTIAQDDASSASVIVQWKPLASRERNAQARSHCQQ